MKTLLSLVSSFFIMISSAFAQTDPNAKIDLTLVAPDAPSVVGETIDVALMASAQTTPQRWLVADVVIGWDPTKLQLLGVSHEGSHPFVWVPPSGFPSPQQDYTGVNEAMPPADGNALYYGYGELGQVFIVTDLVQIVKFQFRVLSQFTETSVNLIPVITVDYPQETVVYGSYIGGMNTTGTLTNAFVLGTVQGIIGDVDGDGTVGPSDMSAILAAWGQTSAKQNPCDLNGDGEVNSPDLGILLANWS